MTKFVLKEGTKRRKCEEKQCGRNLKSLEWCLEPTPVAVTLGSMLRQEKRSGGTGQCAGHLHALLSHTDWMGSLGINLPRPACAPCYGAVAVTQIASPDPSSSSAQMSGCRQKCRAQTPGPGSRNIHKGTRVRVSRYGPLNSKHFVKAARLMEAALADPKRL
jgi:hypothetical protein